MLFFLFLINKAKKIMEGKTTALVLIDMQNDFLYRKGAYPSAGLLIPESHALIGRLQQLSEKVREKDGYIVATLFTLLPAKNGEPIIPEAIKKARPFLKKGDFCPGEFGHELVEELRPADIQVQKIVPSAFHQTFLDYALKSVGIKTLLIGGIVTNSGVVATLRDAQAHGYDTHLLSNGCTAFSEQAHADTLLSLSHVTSIMTCEEAMWNLA